MKQNDWLRIGKMVLYGAGIMAGITMVVCMLLGVLVEKEWVTVELGAVLTKLLIGMGVFLVCYCTAKHAKQSRLPLCLAVAVVYWVICLLCKSMAFPTYKIQFDWWILVLFGAAAAAGVLSSRKPARRR